MIYTKKVKTKKKKRNYSRGEQNDSMQLHFPNLIIICQNLHNSDNYFLWAKGANLRSIDQYNATSESSPYE